MMNTKNNITEQIYVGDLQVTVQRKAIKHIHLNVLPPNGHVRISVPEHTSGEVIRSIIIKRLRWIKKQIKAFETQERQTKRKFISGESHYFRGQRYLMQVIKAKRPHIEIKNLKYIFYYVPEHYTVEQKERYYENWLRKKLRSQLNELIPKWEQITGITVNEVYIKKMKTKWGTCSPEAKRIWINLEMIKKPQKHLEYIILHELLHIIEPTHNEHFHQLLDQYMPDWRLRKQQLNEFIL